MRIQLLLHLGYPKTGSTWLQKNIFPNISSAFFFDFFSDEFNTAHQRLFSSKIEMRKNKKYESEILINKYAEIVYKTIIEKTKNDTIFNFIISNESFLDFQDHYPEINLKRLIQVLEKIKQALLNKKIQMKIKLLAVFREQSSFLQSNYCSNFITLPKKLYCFQKFIEYGLNEPNSTMFEGCFYDKVFETLSNYFKNDITFIPYELLKKDTILFLNLCLVKTSITSPELIRELNLAPKNKNNDRHGANYISKYIIILKYAHLIKEKHKHLIPKFLYKYAKFIYHFTFSHFNNNRTDIKRIQIKLTQPEKEKIFEKYKYSNTRLEKLLNISLSEYSYPLVNEPKLSESNESHDSKK